MSHAHLKSFHARIHDRWIDRICHFLIGIVIFGLVIGVAVSQGRAQTSLRPGAPGLNPSTRTPAPATGPGDNDDIRDIHGPVSIPYAWMWIIYLLSAFIAGGCTYALWRWYSNRKLDRAKLPHEIALEALERARSLMRADSVRGYSFALSEAVRNYIEARFDERAAHRTTEEFLHDLVGKSHSPLATQSALLEEFLTDCDLVKFARYPLNGQQMEAMYTSAKNFVLATRPVVGTPDNVRNPAPAVAA